MRSRGITLFVTAASLLGSMSHAFAADAPAKSSYARDVRPILQRNCVSCHEPKKLKGKLDLSTFAGLKTGGKTGATVVPGDPERSLLVSQVSGDSPEMPEKGDPLRADEVALLARWVKEGAVDDTPAGAASTTTPAPPTTAPVYRIAPVITAMAYSPTGDVIAVAGYHEVLLHRADGSGLVARLLSASPEIGSVAFSGDGSLLLAAGGAPGVFGEIEIWRSSDRQRIKDFTVSGDTLFGASFSPTADRVSFGCADRTARVIDAQTGAERLRLESHSDWVLGTAFTRDGTKLATAGRDKSLKLVAVPSTRPAEEINDGQEPLTCVARHPAEDVVTVGGSQGMLRVYRVADLLQRTEQKKDPNLVRNLERQPGPVNALAYSRDGKWLAAASTGDVRVYSWPEGKRVAQLTGHEGPVFAVAFSPDGAKVCTGGYDGKVRIFDRATQKPIAVFVPVPLVSAPTTRR